MKRKTKLLTNYKKREELEIILADASCNFKGLYLDLLRWFNKYKRGVTK